MAQKTEVFDYRNKAEELESVVSALQNPDIQIDEATELHAKGLKLLDEIEGYLNKAEVIVQKHIADNA
jgi:exodeoxyribonuclease VII small subunit